jgi:DNA-nicking Smr family endonuclease
LKKEKERTADQDAELLRQALNGVIPLAPSNCVSPFPPPRRYPIHSTSQPSVADSLSDHGAGDEPLTEFLRPGISRMVLRKLRRGQFPIQDTLDLHGLNSDEARKLLLEFLQYATRRNLRHVCIIHGKGRRYPENSHAALAYPMYGSAGVLRNATECGWRRRSLGTAKGSALKSLGSRE